MQKAEIDQIAWIDKSTQETYLKFCLLFQRAVEKKRSPFEWERSRKVSKDYKLLVEGFTSGTKRAILSKIFGE